MVFYIPFMQLKTWWNITFPQTSHAGGNNELSMTAILHILEAAREYATGKLKSPVQFPPGTIFLTDLMTIKIYFRKHKGNFFYRG